MATTKTTKLSTENAKFGKLEVEFEITIPESVEEAAGEAFFGSEETVLKVLQSDWERRLQNVARPLIREAEDEQDWNELAANAAANYTPGRRGGFQKPVVSADELASASSVDDILAMLRKAGVQVA
jgi:hypothetical protein